jgi:hypothetical protein
MASNTSISLLGVMRFSRIKVLAAPWASGPVLGKIVYGKTFYAEKHCIKVHEKG